MKCKDCIYCIRCAKFNMKKGMIMAIHQDYYCMKRKRHIKLIEYDCNIECKKYEAKETANEVGNDTYTES